MGGWQFSPHVAAWILQGIAHKVSDGISSHAFKIFPISGLDGARHWSKSFVPKRLRRAELVQIIVSGQTPHEPAHVLVFSLSKDREKTAVCGEKRWVLRWHSRRGSFIILPFWESYHYRPLLEFSKGVSLTQLHILKPRPRVYHARPQVLGCNHGGPSK